jgi:hypothetical protein
LPEGALREASQGAVALAEDRVGYRTELSARNAVEQPRAGKGHYLQYTYEYQKADMPPMVINHHALRISNGQLFRK